MPVPVGAVIVIVPVDTLHVGCVSVTVGIATTAGCGFIVADTAVEVQPPTFSFAMTS